MSSFLGKTIGKIVSNATKSSSNQSEQTTQQQQQQRTNVTTSVAPVSTTSQTSSSSISPDAQLTLTHLRKLFYEYMHPKQSVDQLTQSERDEKLYNILPLFIKTFGGQTGASLSDIGDRFSEVGEFSAACARLLCAEISKRVHDDLVLVKFFEIKTSEDSTDGAGLLNTVNMLASGPAFLAEAMAKCSLPSRLVMCIYLFICLPEPKDSLLDSSEFTARERRSLFQQCFQQLIMKLCQHSCTCDELCEADSLKLLFKIVSSTCEQHNVPWRQTAANALLKLTKSFTNNAAVYVQRNQCIQACLQCMEPHEICSSNLIERFQLLVTLLTFIRETSYTYPLLLDEFRHAQGYKVVVEMALRLERESREDTQLALKNLVYCVEELCSAGSADLKINYQSASASIFGGGKLEGFQQPSAILANSASRPGRTVRNIYAFQCLVNIFNRATGYDACVYVLDSIKNLYKKDERNYFILESQNLVLYSLDDTSIKIHCKNHEIQTKFIEILEFIAFNMKLISSKELVSIGLSIQNFNCTKWNINCAQFLLRLIQANTGYKEVFRELGLLEMCVSCLQKFAVVLKEKHVANSEQSGSSSPPPPLASAAVVSSTIANVQIDPCQKEFGFLIMEILTSLVHHNLPNSKLFRELGGARIAHNMVPYRLCRHQALNIVSTLLLTTAGEDDMSTLLGLMHTARLEDLELKNAVLRSVLNILRESHRTRTVFRKAGGFVYVVSVLISMEGCLSMPARPPWDQVRKSEIFIILKTILNTLTVSMRYEPANAKFFETEVKWKSLCAALKQLGCFETQIVQFPARDISVCEFIGKNRQPVGGEFFEAHFCNLDENAFLALEISDTSPVSDTSPEKRKLLQASSLSQSVDHGLDQRLVHASYIMRFLYDTALDILDNHDTLVDIYHYLENRAYQIQLFESISESSGSKTGPNNAILSRTGSKAGQSALDEPFIIHPGAISSILNLLPSVNSEHNEQTALRIQYNMISLIKNLIQFERNQQIMSNARFVDDILSTSKYVLMEESHFLNALVQHIFERLSTQSITPKSLREYLRLGTIFDETHYQSIVDSFASTNNNNSTILMPLNRVKCLISMTTPRESKLTSTTAFVEFNMFVEGFGCLFLPSISPQLANAPSIVAMGMSVGSSDMSVNGGVGSGERIFPSQSGLTYSSWIYVDRFGFTSKDQTLLELRKYPVHPIRILTIVKHSKVKDTLTACLTVYYSPRSKSLFVSTEEILLQNQLQQQQRLEELVSQPEPIKLNEFTARFHCGDLFQENKWLHVCLVWNRAVLKNSTVTLYINSVNIGTHKLHYIPTALAANQNPANTSIHAIIGTLPLFRNQSPLVWRQGCCFLFEDTMSHATIATLYQLGPSYLGSFQSPPAPPPNASTTLILLESSSISSSVDLSGSTASGVIGNSTSGNTTSLDSSSGNTSSSAALQQAQQNMVAQQTLLNNQLISEEKIIFGLHAQKQFDMTLAKFRRVYNKNDSKAIGKQLNIPSNESVTPLRILSNTAAQLTGASRSVGGVVIGYMGVRTFQPMPVSKSIEHIGGVPFLLGLVAMSSDIEFMYAAVKCLVCIVNSNMEIAREIDRLNAYQLLGMLYKRKKHLINSHILNLTFSLVIDEMSKESQQQFQQQTNGKPDHQNSQIMMSVISNVKAFEYLLGDLEIWYGDTPPEIQRCLHERFNELLLSEQQQQSQQPINARLFHRLGMLKRILYMIRDPTRSIYTNGGVNNMILLNEANFRLALSTIKILVVEMFQPDDLIKFGQFLVSLLPDAGVDENALISAHLTALGLQDQPIDTLDLNLVLQSDSSQHITPIFNLIYSLKLRNRLLGIVDEIVSQTSTTTKSIQFQEEFQRLLGYDWFLLFMQPNLHKTTIVRSVKILFTLLLNMQNLIRFKESAFAGGWLSTILSQLKAHQMSSNQAEGGPAEVQSESAGTTRVSANTGLEVNIEACTAPGFQIMQVLLAKRADLVELYYLLFALLFDAQRIKELPCSSTANGDQQPLDLNLNTICKYVFDKAFDTEQTLFSKINSDVALDVVIIIFSMIRTLMNPPLVKTSPQAESSSNDNNSDQKDAHSASEDYAIILLQIFRFMYHNCDEFHQLAQQPDFLTTLVATLYPTHEMTTQQLNSPSPVEIKLFTEAVCSSNQQSPTSTSPPTQMPSYTSHLSKHAARKLVMDFIRDLAYDNLVNSISNTRLMPTQQPSLVDTVLTICLSNIDTANQKRNQELVTEMFKTIMDHLLASDLFNESNSTAPQSKTSNNQSSGFGSAISLQNLFNLVDRLVDKLWDGLYRRDPKEVFDMCVKLITCIKKRFHTVSLEQLTNAMNRTLLYQLSRPCNTLTEQVEILDVLHKMTKLKSLIFATSSNTSQQSEFYACVTHCLLQITQKPSSDESTSNGSSTSTTVETGTTNKSQWYTQSLFNDTTYSDANQEQATTIAHPSHNVNARYLLVSAAQRVWLDLYLNKKSQLEESLKVSLDSIGKNPTLDELRATLTEPSTKCWNLFVENGNDVSKSKQPIADKIQSQLHAKLQRVVSGGITSMMSGGLTRVVSMKKQKKEIARLGWRELADTTNILIVTNLLVIKDYLDVEWRRFFVVNQERHAYLHDEWLRTERDVLLRERALWGEQAASLVSKYKLDFTEGPNRQRKRLINNTDDFYRCYPYRPELEAVKPSKKYKTPSSMDSKEFFKHFRVKCLLQFDDYLRNFLLEQERYIVLEQQYGSLVQKQGLCEQISSPIPVDVLTANTGELSPLPHLQPTQQEDSIDSLATLTNKNRKLLSKDQSDSVFTTTDETTAPMTLSNEEEHGVLATQISELSGSTHQSTGNTDNNGIISSTTPATSTSQTASASSTSNNATISANYTSNNQNILRLLEEGEKINHIYRCARVQGLDTTEGVFLFGKEHFYILDGFTLVSTKDIVEIDSLKSSSYEPLIPKCGGSVSTGSTSSGSTSSMPSNLSIPEKTFSKFAYEEIREVHNRRYLLQEIAMEIFSNDGRNYLLVFPRKCRNKVYDRLVALTPDLTDSASQSIAGQRRTVNIESNSGGSFLLNALIGEKSVVQRWERGEISNFQYLMFLNTLAGRSYNDLMQYPVFPWILADYDSPELDLTDPASFRDLSKPMGAQTQERLRQFEKRFAEWEDPQGETPPYHYGTHYSSAMIVASYLLRMEPFTQIFLRLQGGHFDLADRLFHSVKDAWLSASRNNMADVKELIPEFFYLPEFLVNSNKFDLGRKQNGVQLDDIVLPPWAKNDAREFIRIHRTALESDYVSAHLNEWIDLIFGYKQQGQSAVDSMNVFHHLFYEGAVNIDEIDDPLKRNAIIGFINNFGQIPKQLFKKPHPSKKLSVQLIHGPTSLASNLINATAANLVGAVNTGQSGGSSSNTLTSNSSSSNLQSDHHHHHHQNAHQNQPLVFINSLKSLKPSLQPIKELKGSCGQIVPTDKGGIIAVEQNKFLMPPSYQRYIAWGFTDESIKIGYTDYEKSYVTFENVQDGAIFCCASPDSKSIVTAGTSSTVNVWELSKAKNKRLQLKARLYGHTDTVTCMAVSNAFHMLVTGSRDNSCIIWDSNKWQFVRQLTGHLAAVSCICINELTGDIATASSTYLYLWNINGELLASVNTISSSRNHIVLSICMSQVNEWDSNNVILTGGTDGVVRMWSLGYVQEPCEKEKQSKCVNQQLGGLLFSGEQALSKSMIEQTARLMLDNHEEGAGSSSNHLEESNVSSTLLSPNNMDDQGDEDGNEKPRFFAVDSEEVADTIKQQESITENENDKPENENKKQPDVVEEDFVVIESNPFNDSSSPDTSNILKPGYKWKRELIFKSKLTMHTSYDRKDNSEPASVTAISVSKDHKTIYVGDSRGRIFSWVCTEMPGKQRADHWLKEDVIEQCKSCHTRFSFSERKHHCRDCGQVFCAQCTRYEIEIPRLNINKPVRVCQSCYNNVNNSMVKIDEAVTAASLQSRD